MERLNVAAMVGLDFLTKWKIDRSAIDAIYLL